ncbi:hypothetical protein [Ferrimonas sp. YFM]|uniref:hypothetical protein n=1 Tax=Ferrimonas sp. YFM TaxID=3028878 RepID=UPI002573AD45|nr:hypothetical protein [Ferrimonas sp. YFM]BDY04567.1 hypothetical protein F0521_16080 [Ferrimonas sp. YFM]
MSFVRAVGHQWQKASLAHQLRLSIAPSAQLRQYFTGNCRLTEVTHVIAALVFAEGQPKWLPEVKPAETPLDDDIVLYCLFDSARLLFIREVEGGELKQSEQLVMTLAEQWAYKMLQQPELTNEHISLCQLLQRISQQTRILRQQSRRKRLNMVMRNTLDWQPASAC